MRPGTYKENGPRHVETMMKLAMTAVVASEPDVSVDRAKARSRTAEILSLLITMDAIGMLPPRDGKHNEELSEALSFAVTTSKALEEVRRVANMQVSHLIPVKDDLNEWAEDMAKMVKNILEFTPDGEATKRKKK